MSRSRSNCTAWATLTRRSHDVNGIPTFFRKYDEKYSSPRHATRATSAIAIRSSRCSLTYLLTRASLGKYEKARHLMASAPLPLLEGERRFIGTFVTS